MTGSSGTPPETYLRDALEESRRENVILHDRVRELEAAVAALKHSVFVLSTDTLKRSVVGVSHLSYGPHGFMEKSDSAIPGIANSATEPSSSDSGGAAGSIASPVLSKIQQPVTNVVAVNSATMPATRTLSRDRASSRIENHDSSINIPSGARAKGNAHGYVSFVKKVDLIAHSAAVYAVRFSPRGAYLVTASFDRSVVVWEMDNYISSANSNPLVSISDAHRAPVVDVAWTADSEFLITGGFDASAAEWNVEASTTSPLNRYHCHGLVNAVATSPEDINTIFAGTSRGSVHSFDRRVPQKVSQSIAANLARLPSKNGAVSMLSAAARGPYDESTVVVNNETAINSLYVELNGRRLLTGDHGGAIKTWDLRMTAGKSLHRAQANREPASLFDTTYNDTNRRPITHIHASPVAFGEDHGRCFAINSYDNYLRVYDRGSLLFGSKKSEMKPLHVLRGVINRNWPIKSSFFVGREYRPPRAVARRLPKPRQMAKPERACASSSTMGSVHVSALGTQSHTIHIGEGKQFDQSVVSTVGTEQDGVLDEDSELDSDDDRVLIYDSTSDEDEVTQHVPASGGKHRRSRESSYHVRQMPIQEALVLASGSADGNIYMFDVGGSAGSGDIVQVLEGHRDRVHAVDFHPSEPILASCSADALVKIWAPPARHQI